MVTPRCDFNPRAITCRGHCCAEWHIYIARYLVGPTKRRQIMSARAKLGWFRRVAFAAAILATATLTLEATPQLASAQYYGGYGGYGGYAGYPGYAYPYYPYYPYYAYGYPYWGWGWPWWGWGWGWGGWWGGRGFYGRGFYGRGFAGFHGGFGGFHGGFAGGGFHGGGGGGGGHR
jgi:hypothetical protein